MAVQVFHFPIVVATGSTPGSPQVTQMTMPDRVVSWIEVDVPPGPKGSVGFYIASSHSQVVPFTASPPLYRVADDRQFHWDLTGQATTGDWQLVAYNLGNFPHTLRVDFGVDLTGNANNVAPYPVPIPASQLGS